MLYSEFIDGTGCKDSTYNYKVYQQLEALYMENEILTKADIYEIGKRLVDNNPTEEQQQFINRLKEEMQHNSEYIEDLIFRVEQYKHFAETAYYNTDALYWKRQIRQTKETIATYKNRNRELQYILS